MSEGHCFHSFPPNFQGTPLSSTEATETFFAVTKLFQSQDLTLRRLVYLAIKEMSKIADDVIIVTSSLTKDMTGKEDQYRASAIRALITITDVSECVCVCAHVCVCVCICACMCVGVYVCISLSVCWEG